MNLKDTAEMMNSTEYKERFKAEYFQLKIRVNELSKTLFEYKAGTLNFKPSCSFELLNNQLYNMRKYLRVLAEIAEIEGIDLNI